VNRRHGGGIFWLVVLLALAALTAFIVWVGHGQDLTGLVPV
jgi:hypothetical protein